MSLFRAGRARVSLSIRSFSTPSKLYDTLVQRQAVSDDAAQRQALGLLDNLCVEISKHQTEMVKHHGALKDWRSQVDQTVEKEINRVLESPVQRALRFLRLKPDIVTYRKEFEAETKSKTPPPAPPVPPKGVYLYGGVGVGKSFLMDLLFESTASRLSGPRMRVHFHSFMLQLHSLMHQYALSGPVPWSPEHKTDPLTHAATALVGSGGEDKVCALLCFDEFQLNEVGDAVILRGLLQRLLSAGVCVVFTSNRSPDLLNQGTLRRPDFEKFLTQLRESTHWVPVEGAQDYRMSGEMPITQLYLTPDNDETRSQLRQAFQLRCESESGESEPRQVSLMFGRQLPVQRARGGVAYFTFSELCEAPRSAVDFFGLSKVFHTICIEGIPQMSLQNRDSARRFITLVDELYNHKVTLLCTATVPCSDLFSGTSSSSDVLDQAEQLQYEGSMARSGVSGLRIFSGSKALTLFTGEDEIFTFRRAISRLHEMQQPHYLRESQQAWARSRASLQ
eukprot:c19478_g1_i3.p1 GENE.c19478_g1_i3~~c19478_g1_i3.p1  ORF type:complete len:506 (+),score=101.93 c19478_g1_i3:73-1590(+)